MNKIRLKSPATTANVGPGYDIFSMALAEPFDEFEIALNNSKEITIEVLNNNQNIPVEVSDNTAGLALIELFKRKKISTGISVKINKNIFSGAGLGTTGASAAAAIYGANKLLELEMDDNELIEFARYGEIASGGSPHADNVAAAMLGGFILIKSYNPIDVLKLTMPDFPVILAVIRKSQRTTRGFITYEIGQEKLKDQMAHCSSVIHSILTNNIAEFGKAISVDHIAEPVRGAAIQEYKQVKEQVLSAGAFGCNISGGGSSVFTICDPSHVEKIAGIMKQGFSVNPNFHKVIITSTSNKGIVEI
jgi:homoserine kinase